MILSPENKCLLLRLAREEIINHLLPYARKREKDLSIPAELKINSGAFVSLYVDKELRGCIGTFSEDEPLIKNVKRMAYSAANHDSRFSSISAEDCDRLKIEISVLSPRVPISGPDQIEIGKHGIFMELGTHRGTLLPQVAVDQNWTAEEFLRSCAKYKTGLGRDGWKTAHLYTYEAIVFDSDVFDNC